MDAIAGSTAAAALAVLDLGPGDTVLIGGAGGGVGVFAVQLAARLVAAGRLRVPIAARFPVEQVRAAVELQAGRHVRGKVVVDL